MSTIQKLQSIVDKTYDTIYKRLNITISDNELDKEAHDNRMHHRPNSRWCGHFNVCEYCTANAE